MPQEEYKETVRKAIASSRRLAEMDPHDEAVQRTIDGLQKQISLISEQAREDRGWGKKSMEDDVKFIGQQIQKLKAAASIPAHNYKRILSILNGLEGAHKLASRPQNVALRPRVVEQIKRIAGVFAEVDTVQDLDKPLEQIEKAVHALYSGGKQNDPATYNFEARGKGHQTKTE
jgi:hypothetical protein